MNGFFSFWVLLSEALKEGRYGIIFSKMHLFITLFFHISYVTTTFVLRFIYGTLTILFFYLSGFRAMNVYRSPFVHCIIIYRAKNPPKEEEINETKYIINYYDLITNEIYRSLSISPNKLRVAIMCDDLWIENTTAFCYPSSSLTLIRFNVLRGSYDSQWGLMNPQEAFLYDLLHEFGHILKRNKTVDESLDEWFANMVGFGLSKAMLPFVCLKKYLWAVYKYNISSSIYGHSVSALKEFFQAVHCLADE